MFAMKVVNLYQTSKGLFRSERKANENRSVVSGEFRGGYTQTSLLKEPVVKVKALKVGVEYFLLNQVTPSDIPADAL